MQARRTARRGTGNQRQVTSRTILVLRRRITLKLGRLSRGETEPVLRSEDTALRRLVSPLSLHMESGQSQFRKGLAFRTLTYNLFLGTEVRDAESIFSYACSFRNTSNCFRPGGHVRLANATRSIERSACTSSRPADFNGTS